MATAETTGGRQRAFSLAADDMDRPQPVEVYVRGVRYPGEVVVSRNWTPAFGEPLRGHAMFRLVLLTDACVVTCRDLRDSRIAVAVPSENEDTHPERLNAEMRALRETRSRYATASDPGLDRLGSALRDRVEAIEGEMAARMRAAWAAGAVTTAVGPAGLSLFDAATIFAVDDPQVWVEAIGGALIMARYKGLPGIAGADPVAPLTPGALGDAFDRLVSGGDARDEAAREPRGRGAPGGCVLDALDDLMAGGELPGERVRAVLVHEMGFPPDVASLHLVMRVKDRDTEIVLIEKADLRDRRGRKLDCPRLIADMLPDMEWAPDLLNMVAAIRPEVSDEWDSALPYLRLILPDARPSAEGAGPAEQAAAFAEALETLEGRFTLALGVLDRLEQRLGETGRTVNVESERLFITLSSTSWRTYFTRGRGEFGSVKALREALETLAGSRRAGEEALVIERCARFLDEADFGPDERDLALQARAVRARIDLRALVDNPDLWPPILEGFERWRAEYRVAYLEHHAARRTQNRDMRQRMERTEHQMTVVERLGQIPELGSPPDPSLRPRWQQLSEGVTVCPAREEEIALVDHPWCEHCRARLGVQFTYDNLEEIIHEIETVLAGYNERLSSATVRDILAGRRREEVEKILAIVAAGGMEALAGVLDDDVVRFLGEFMRDAESVRRSDEPN